MTQSPVTQSPVTQSPVTQIPVTQIRGHRRAPGDLDERVGRPVFCYVVLAHHQPELVLRLVRRIRALSPGSVVLVRHAEPDGFLSADQVTAAGGRLFRSRIPMRWGSWEMTEGMIEALEAATTTDASWFVALSGQCYPVLDLAAWEDDLVAEGTAGVVEADLLTDTSRYRYRFTFVSSARSAAFDRVVRGSLRRVAKAAWWYGFDKWQHTVWLAHLPRGLGYGIGVRRRSALIEEIGCWKGAQWLGVSRAVLEGVLALHHDRPELAAHFRRTYIPDEAYLQTLAHLTGLPVRSGRTTWSRFENGESHPRPVDARTVREARAAGVPFARKVDPGDLAFLDTIDASTVMRVRASVDA